MVEECARISSGNEQNVFQKYQNSMSSHTGDCYFPKNLGRVLGPPPNSEGSGSNSQHEGVASAQTGVRRSGKQCLSGQVYILTGAVHVMSHLRSSSLL